MWPRQGAQFSATAEMIRNTPLATYQWIRNRFRAGHNECIYYLELIWHYLLRPGMQEEAAEHEEYLLQSRTALRAGTKVKRSLPFFSHMGPQARRFMKRAWGNKTFQRKHCAAAQEG